MTPIQTRWLQHLAATSRVPPHELARRVRQPLQVLADVWGVTVADLEPPKPPEAAAAVPPARQLAPPELVPHLTVGDFSRDAHAGIPVDDSSGPVIPAPPKSKPPRQRLSETNEDRGAPGATPKAESVAERYERLRAIQEEHPLLPPSGPTKIA